MVYNYGNITWTTGTASGGSATTGGGTGMAKALGYKFLDKDNNELPEGGGSLIDLHKIDTASFDKRFNSIDIIVACDVNNPLCGLNGAAHVYSPQKGADSRIVLLLDDALKHFAKVVKRDLSKDILDLPGAGAAGGLGGGLFAFAGAKLTSGVSTMIQATNLESLIKDADLIITGEGQVDYQTAYGKVPSGIAKIAKTYSKPLVCIAGSLGKDYDSLYEIGITSIFSICDKPMTLDYAMQNAETLITNLTRSIIRQHLAAK